MADQDENQVAELQRRLTQMEMLLSALWLIGADLDESRRRELGYLIAQINKPTSDRDQPQNFSRYLANLSREVRPGSIVMSGPELFNEVRGITESLRSNSAEDRRRISDIERRIESSEGKIASVRGLLGAVEEQQKSLQEETHAFLAIQSLGIDPGAVPLHRFVPLRVYLSSGGADEIEAVSGAIDSLLAAFGFSISDDFPPIKGSWWKRWFAKTKEVATQPEVAERLEKVERALELKGLHAPQAAADQLQASAVAKLIKSLDTVPRAALQVGSILLVKLPSANGEANVHVRTLTQRK